MVKLTIRFNLVLRVGMHGALRPLPLKSSWRGTEGKDNFSYISMTDRSYVRYNLVRRSITGSFIFWIILLFHVVSCMMFSVLNIHHIHVKTDPTRLQRAHGFLDFFVGLT